MKIILICAAFLIAKVIIAQEQEWDTIYFKDDYLVKCACIKNKKAVVDLVSLEDLSMVNRFVFDYEQNNKTKKIEKEDTIKFTYARPYVKNYLSSYSSVYMIYNRDSLLLFVYQPSYKNMENKRLFAINDQILPNYKISKKITIII